MKAQQRQLERNTRVLTFSPFGRLARFVFARRWFFVLSPLLLIS